ncbi:UPAR/Ly6 domain-containing protein rtv [Atheta coriaria]|uniref:UPAR/Ly6 domain-containing protein rtv n=1 Tax=Dalotia coriaria TaxID=877792 RepID=UPI0031F3AF4D
MRLLMAVIFVVSTFGFTQGIQRCFVCRSRGEMGSCKDQFTYNATQIESKDVKGVEMSPCASGWCGKIVETESNAPKEEYGVATQRICLQRGPSDGEDRCAYTKWQYRPVLMCFCRGDLCNSAINAHPSWAAILLSVSLLLARLYY